jgi:hypothetical protein
LMTLNNASRAGVKTASISAGSSKLITKLSGMGLPAY